MLIRVFVLAAFLVTIVQSSAFAGRQDFTFVNNTGKIVNYLYLSPSGNGSWEYDVLGRNQVIYHGDSVFVPVSGYDDQYWDIRVVTNDGNDWAWYGIDLFSVSTVTVDGAGTAHY